MFGCFCQKRKRRDYARKSGGQDSITKGSLSRDAQVCISLEGKTKCNEKSPEIVAGSPLPSSKRPRSESRSATTPGDTVDTGIPFWESVDADQEKMECSLQISEGSELQYIDDCEGGVSSDISPTPAVSFFSPCTSVIGYAAACQLRLRMCGILAISAGSSRRI